MSDIFREVDEAMQQEKLLNLWHEYKATIIGAIALLLLTATGTTLYKNWDYSRNAEETARLMQAFDSNNNAELLVALQEDTRNKHGAIATFVSAGIFLEDNKEEEASNLYLNAAESRKTPRDLRDLARLLYVQNTPEPKINILKPLLSNDKSPWTWHARIEAAVISANINNNYDEALSYLSKFSDDVPIPPSLKQRAEALKHIYTLKNIDKQAEEIQE